ncbi:hypothetical protein GCM10007857_11330 [Bradyrhizobium iriomotense]|uniref:Uncharacterized protein n=1 Tax=Bradyrhizobium iriomotense TaxID=441950 RepID=A0ABQ6AS61_9BRAD|nr:hypothetical protein GCM10007857_11330 [Bradyrhizobium iriomotense]
MIERAEMTNPENARGMNESRRCDPCEGGRNGIDVAEIKRQVIKRRVIEWPGAAADAGDAPAVTQQAFNDRGADP